MCLLQNMYHSCICHTQLESSEHQAILELVISTGKVFQAPDVKHFMEHFHRKLRLISIFLKPSTKWLRSKKLLQVLLDLKLKQNREQKDEDLVNQSMKETPASVQMKFCILHPPKQKSFSSGVKLLALDTGLWTPGLCLTQSKFKSAHSKYKIFNTTKP